MLNKCMIIIFFNIFINISCLNDFENINLFKSNSKINKNDYSILEVGKIRNEDINDEKIFIFKNEKYKNNLLVNFFSINCDIQIYINDIYNNETLNNIRNNDSFSIRINLDEIKNTKIKVLHLKNDNNKFRTCPLVINTIYEKNSKLEFKGKEPTILFFDKYLEEIELSYNYEKDSFVTFSFIFNEIASFDIIYSYNGENKKIKSISNSKNIFLYDLPEIKKKIINIKIIRTDIYEYPVLLTFRVFTNNPTPYILQKNYLNQGFITSNLQNQYYYMEIFKDEVGEIMLHDKRQNGKIIGKICKKNDIDYNDINSFPVDDDEKDYLKYNATNKKLKIEYSKTKDCQEGCYLLITYHHEIDYENNDKLIIGYEFTLLERVWNYEDWYLAPIINIPNNEYIFGYFEENFLNHHYYSIFVSDETDKIIVQIKSNYIQGFYGEGKKRLNTYRNLTNTIDLEVEKEMIYVEDKMFKNKYVSFAFRSKNFFEKELSFYYFRVLQFKEKDTVIIPLDSNVINTIKQPKDYDGDNDDNYSFCYFLLKNEYNEFSLNYSIFSTNQNEEYTLNYREYPFEDKLDITQENLNNLIYNDYFSFKQLDTPVKFLSKNNNNISFILFSFSFFHYYNNKNILSTFYKSESKIYPHIYSSEIYILDYITNFDFSMDINCLLNLRWINGEGQINSLTDKNFELNENFIGMVHSFSIDDIEDKNKNIIFINQNESIFYLELDYIKENNIIREITVDQPTSEVIKNKKFPFYYFIKSSSEINLDINFKLLDFVDDFTIFTIEGMKCKGNILDDFNKGKYIDFKKNYVGQYDFCSKIGLLQIHDSNNYENGIYEIEDGEENEDYILIKIDVLDSKIYLNGLIQIICMDTYFSITLIPINQFITGSLNLTDLIRLNYEEYYKYYIISNEEGKNNTIIIEFSKNYEGINLKLDDYDCQIENKNGFKKYIFNEYEKLILLTLELTNISNNTNLLNANYMLRYYIDNDKFNNYELKLNTNYSIKDCYTNSENKTLISIEFKYEINNNNNNKTNNKTNNIIYKIYSSLFLDDNKSEILNTSAITLSQSLNQTFVLVNYDNDNDNDNDNKKFYINMTFNVPKSNNYKFIMQIKVDVDNDDYYQKMGILSYSIPMDLAQYLKEEDKKSQINNKLIIIVSLISIIIIIILIIILIIIYKKIKMKNKDLKDKVLSIFFEKGETGDVLCNEVELSQKDEEYETKFI